MTKGDPINPLSQILAFFCNLLISNKEIDMKECSAYGQVISPQTATEQPHIHESTT